MGDSVLLLPSSVTGLRYCFRCVVRVRGRWRETREQSSLSPAQDTRRRRFGPAPTPACVSTLRPALLRPVSTWPDNLQNSKLAAAGHRHSLHLPSRPDVGLQC